MDCPLCGIAISDGARRCQGCGTVLPFDWHEAHAMAAIPVRSGRRHNFMSVVGESHYQETLRSALRQQGRELTVTLEPEPENPHDPNAVRVALDGRTVGYLKREVAKQFHGTLRSLESPLAVPGEIRGGEDTEGEHLGVTLDFSDIYALKESPTLTTVPCPRCDRAVPLAAKVCGACGEPRPEPAPIVAAPEPPALPAMRACPFCAEEIRYSAKVCKHCQRDLATGTVGVAQMVVTCPAWSRGVAAVLSLVIPGAGQMYKGQIANGLVWFLFVVIGYVMFIVPGLFLHLFCIIGAASGDPFRRA